MLRRIYLDNSATTPVDERVLREMMPYLTQVFGNPSSVHYFGQQAKAAIDKARHQVASLINARPAEIVFTSGGTESNNLAIRGMAQTAVKLLGRDRFDNVNSYNSENKEFSGVHIIISNIEHTAVYNVSSDLESRGAIVTCIPVNHDGVISPSDVEVAIGTRPTIISIMTANNEIGTIQPVREIAEIVRRHRERGQKIWLHTDAVQAVGKIPIDVEELGCDLLSISGHKLYAPKGVGALYIRRGVKPKPQNLGGHQERDRRGGTEAVPNIVALGAACSIVSEVLNEEARRIESLRDRLENAILEEVPEVFINGSRTARVPNISNVSFTGIEGEALLINLDMHGIAVSTGSACSSGTIEPSPVIKALGRDDGLARGAVRFSFGRFNSDSDVDAAIDAVRQAVSNLRRLSHVTAGGKQ
ncbi:MAG: cysteine desulfurase NifS [Blastocatellia bacterium]